MATQTTHSFSFTLNSSAEIASMDIPVSLLILLQLWNSHSRLRFVVKQSTFLRVNWNDSFLNYYQSSAGHIAQVFGLANSLSMYGVSQHYFMNYKIHHDDRTFQRQYVKNHPTAVKLIRQRNNCTIITKSANN